MTCPGRHAQQPSKLVARGASASKPIVAIRLNPDCTRCALAFEDGELEVVEFSMGDGGEKKTGRVSGRYEAGIPEAHKGAMITSLEWSPGANGGGDAFVCGDNRGMCSVVVLEGKNAGAHTIRFKQPIAQVSFLEDGSAALVSTSEQLYLLHRQDGFKKSKVGSKPRDGPFGAAPHPIAHMGVPEGLELDMYMGANAAAGHDWFFGARPGRRLWLCRVPHGAMVPEGEVVATLRPSLPQASAPPGGAVPTKMPKKWEFGRVHPIGPCLLTVSEKALAVVDFVGAAVLAWYPMESMGGGSSSSSSSSKSRLGLAVEGPRAFVLGADGGVWCLQAPHTAAALVRSTAMLAALAGGTPEMTEDEQALMADPSYHAKRLAAKFGIDPPPMTPMERPNNNNGGGGGGGGSTGYTMGKQSGGSGGDGGENGGGVGGGEAVVGDAAGAGVGVGVGERASSGVRMGGSIGDYHHQSNGGSGGGDDLMASSERVQELTGAIAATSAAGEGAAAAARAAAAAMFDEADPLKWRNKTARISSSSLSSSTTAAAGGSIGGVGGNGAGVSSVSGSYFPVAAEVFAVGATNHNGNGGRDFPIAAEADEPIGIITRTRNPRVKRTSSKKRVAGIEDAPPGAVNGGNSNGNGAIEPLPLGSTVGGVLRQYHEGNNIQNEAALASSAGIGEDGFDFRLPIRRTRIVEGEESDDDTDTVSTVSEALTDRTTEGGGNNNDGFLGGGGANNGCGVGVLLGGPSVRQIDVMLRAPGAGGGGGGGGSGAGAGFGSPVPTLESGRRETAGGAAAEAALPVVMDDDGNLLLDNLDMLSSSAIKGTPQAGAKEGPGAEEGDAGISPSIDMWLEKKEEARKAAAAAAAAAREMVTSPPGPATPPGDKTFKKTNSNKEEEDEYDVLVREAESLALELDRVVQAEAREAAQDQEERQEAAEKNRGGGSAAMERNGSLTRISDYSSDDDDDNADAAGTPLPFGAAVASPPSGILTTTRAESPPDRDLLNRRVDIPPSPQADEKTRVAPISPWPWWMVMLGCDGCGSVRPNKQHKYTFEEDEAVMRSASVVGGSSDLMGAIFGSSSSGPAALPTPPDGNNQPPSSN